MKAKDIALCRLSVSRSGGRLWGGGEGVGSKDAMYRGNEEERESGAMSAPYTMSAVAAETGWAAALELAFRRVCGRTVPARRESRGPLRIQRPFYPEGESAISIMHPPGGIVSGDTWRSPRAEADARVCSPRRPRASSTAAQARGRAAPALRVDAGASLR